MKRLLLVIVAIGVVAGAIGLYMYNKPTADASASRTDARAMATELMSAFAENEEKANQVYLGKVVEVTGAVEKVGSNDDGTAVIHLESGAMLGSVVCNMSKSIDNLPREPRKGESVTIKGTCSGYLMDVILERSVLLKETNHN